MTSAKSFRHRMLGPFAARPRLLSAKGAGGGACTSMGGGAQGTSKGAGCTKGATAYTLTTGGGSLSTTGAPAAGGGL